MCKSQSEGGQRCELSDKLANERHKVRSKLKGQYPSEVDRQVKKAVEKFRRENPDLVNAHLPETQPFQVAPSKKHPQQKYLDMFTPGRTPITGTKTAEEHAELIKKLYGEYQKAISLGTDDEDRAVSSYTYYGNNWVNTYLRRSGYAELCKKEQTILWDREEERYRTPQEHAEHYVKPMIRNLEGFIEKAEKSGEPRKLYRFIEIPAGVDPKTYTEKYFEAGQAYQDKGFMSTTADPDFIYGLTKGSVHERRKKNFLVLEIVTKQGASLQQRDHSDGGDIQSLEAEVLLPRNMKMRIIDKPKKRSIKLSHDRPDLANQFHGYYSRERECLEGQKASYHVVQLLDEKLIAEG